MTGALAASSRLAIHRRKYRLAATDSPNWPNRLPPIVVVHGPPEATSIRVAARRSAASDLDPRRTARAKNGGRPFRGISKPSPIEQAEGGALEAIAAYLCDPSLTFPTGDTITIDGGYTIF